MGKKIKLGEPRYGNEDGKINEKLFCIGIFIIVGGGRASSPQYRYAMLLFSQHGMRMRFVLELLTFWFVFWFGLLFSV